MNGRSGTFIHTFLTIILPHRPTLPHVLRQNHHLTRASHLESRELIFSVIAIKWGLHLHLYFHTRLEYSSCAFTWLSMLYQKINMDQFSCTSSFLNDIEFSSLSTQLYMVLYRKWKHGHEGLSTACLSCEKRS